MESFSSAPTETVCTCLKKNELEKIKFGSLTDADTKVIFLRAEKTGGFWVGTESVMRRGRLLEGGNLELTRFAVANGDSPVWLTTSSGDGLTYFATPDSRFYLHHATLNESNSVLMDKPFVTLEKPIRTYSMEVDGTGRIWVGTNIGVVLIDQDKTISQPLAHQLDSRFGFEHSVSSDHGSSQLVFGGIRGILGIPNNLEIDHSVAPRMSWTGVTSDQERSNSEREVVLAGDTNSLILNYSVVDYFQPHMSSYRHKLEGFDKDWVETGSLNQTTYTNLRPGSYMFQVQGADSRGVWNLEGLRLKVTVLPPWWLAWWALCLYAALALLALTIFKRWYDSIVLRNLAVKHAREMTKAADLAIDELQNEIEIQDQILSSFSSRNLDLFALLQIRRSNNSPMNESRRDIVSDQNALACLENSLVAFEEDLQFSMGGYANELLALYLEEGRGYCQDVITIVDVSELPLGSLVASRLALTIHAFLEFLFQDFSERAHTAPVITISLKTPVRDTSIDHGWILLLSAEQVTWDDGTSVAFDRQISSISNRIWSDTISSPIITATTDCVRLSLEFPVDDVMSEH